MLTLSVVIPAFNEERNIRLCLERIVRSLETTSHANSFELLVVVDGAVDRTAEEAKSINRPEIKVISYPENKGKGHALKVGTANSKGSVVAFFDGDLDLLPISLVTLLNLYEENPGAAVVGSKIHPMSHVQYPWFRRLQSRIMRFIVGRLFCLRISDTQTGVKVFEGETLRELMQDIRSSGFVFDVEILVRLNESNVRILEGPVDLDYQFDSSIHPAVALKVIVDLLALKKRIGRKT